MKSNPSHCPYWLALLICAGLTFSGCGSQPEESASQSSRVELSVVETSEPAEAAWVDVDSSANDMSFSHPGDWTVKEDANTIVLSSGANLDSAIMFADITYEVSLFLAGHGNLEDSIDALVDKYAGLLADGAKMENYTYKWDTSADGNIMASCTFTMLYDGVDCKGRVVVDQLGGRVILTSYVRAEDDRASQSDEIYNQIHESVQVGGTDRPLEAADLSHLGFPEAPSGFYRFYSPVTGQFFIYPQDWDLVTDPHDEYVMLFNDEGAIMITENWTDSFYEIYNSNGQDEVECFDYFLDECADVLENIYGQELAYHDFEYMATKNQELIKATFNYSVGGSVGRCFAELGIRPYNDTDQIQATLCLYRVGDSYSIDVFSIIMDSTVIYYPEL